MEFSPISSRPVRVAVVGYGFAGKSFHSYLVSLVPGLSLHGIVVRSDEKRALAKADYPEARLYQDLSEALDDPEIDLVVLATPNSTHCELATQALDAGKHVVTDKIMCLDLAECDRMIEAAQRNQRLLSVFQNRRWDGDFLTVRKLRDDGRLGELRWFECAWQGPKPMRRWRGEAASGGGRFYDLGAHLIDQCLQLFPAAIDSVYCRMHHDHPETDTESHAMLTIAFADGCTAIVDTGSMHYISKPRMYAAGGRGTFAKHGLDPQEEAMKAGRIDQAKEDPKLYGTLKTDDGEETIPTLPGRWRNYYETIAAQLTDKEPPAKPVELREARRVMAVVDAALQSAKSGQAIQTQIEALDPQP